MPFVFSGSTLKLRRRKSIRAAEGRRALPGLLFPRSLSSDTVPEVMQAGRKKAAEGRPEPCEKCAFVESFFPDPAKCRSGGYTQGRSCACRGIVEGRRD